MKTIITIFLTLCMFGSLQGQGRFEKIMEEAAKKTDMELLETGKLADVRGVQDAINQQQDHFDKAVGKSFLRLWDRYAEECCNDSSESYVEVTWQADSVGLSEGGFIKLQKPTWTTRYAHFHNPTPLEFIEWLKKQ